MPAPSPRRPSAATLARSHHVYVGADVVVKLIAEATEIPLDDLREVREASHLTADLPFDRARALKLLERLVAGIWWPQ